jgi:hypothetical protein
MDKFEGLKSVLDILIEKQTYFQTQLGKAHDAGEKFKLKKDLEEIAEQIKMYRSDYHASKSVMLLLISTDKENIELHTKEENKHKKEILDLYGKIPFDWVVYQENNKKYSFTELIIDFQKKSKINLDIYVLDTQNYKSLSCLEDLKDKFITIIDCLALDIIPERKDICRRIDARKIGGCLLPICESLHNDIKKKMQDAKNTTFKVLCGETTNNFEVSLGHIELELPTKNDFFRRLSNIIFGFSLIIEKAHNQYQSEAAKKIQDNKIDLGI